MTILRRIVCFFLFIIVLVDILYRCDGVKDLDIYSLHIKSDIKLRYATTLITSRVVNKSPNVSYEATFDVTLPNQAMISNFTMEIDGVIYPGQVKEKAAAQKQYEKAKKKGQSAGQVKARPRETNKFSVNVNVAAQGKITFNLTYQELLERKKGMYQHVIYINPGQPVDDFKVDVSISESRDITRVIVPPVADERLSNNLITEERNIEAQVVRPSPKSAYIGYHPTIDKQKEMDANNGISGLFRVFYDVGRPNKGGEILAVNGYFVHFFAPEGLETVGKNVLFIIDVSGSMTGVKIQQVRQAMKIILKDMHEGDWFSIMRFSSKAITWPHGFVEVNKENIAKGLKYAKQTKAGGWTNINEALLNGIEQLKEQEGNRAGIIVFLTDGEPSKGETNPKRILANVRDENEGAQIYSLAFGSGADYDFVKKVAAQNYGVGRKIYEDSDADLQIAGFYDDISAAVLQNVQFQYVGGEIDNETTTLSNIKTFFNGSEFIVAGKLRDLSVDSLSTQIIANGAEGSFELSLDTPITEVNVDETVGGLTKLEDLQKITEKIWAYLTIKQLLKQELHDITEEERQEIRAKILEKALKYNFVTPVTSMVVTKPEKSDITDLEGADKLDEISRQGQSAASPGQRGRASQYGAGGDPHFQVWFNGISEPICFTVRVEQGEVYRLVEDKDSGLQINARIIQGNRELMPGISRTYIGTMYVKWRNEKILIDPHRIFISGHSQEWKHGSTYHSKDVTCSVSHDGTIVNIHLVDYIRLQIQRVVYKNGHVDYLNFVLGDETRLSEHAEGLLGQFIHKTAAMSNTGNEESMSRRNLILSSNDRSHQISVDLVLQKKLLRHTYRPCWYIEHPEDGVFDANPKTYRIDNLFG